MAVGVLGIIVIVVVVLVGAFAGVKIFGGGDSKDE
jgi:hypothetical protein